MPSKATNSPPQVPLTFQWDEPVRQGRRLGFWVFTVIVGLTVFFYLFQVVYPQTQRFTPVPQQVIVLNPADPAAMALLSRVQDRDYLLLPSDTDATAGPSLQEHAPVFHPSFEGHQLRALDLPYKAFTVPPARLLNVDKTVLPPLDLSELKAAPAGKAESAAAKAPASPKAKLSVSIVGDLAKRPLVAPPDLSQLALHYPDSCRFQLGVNAEGRVEFILPMEASEKSEISPQVSAQVLDQLQVLQFQPLAATGGVGAPPASKGKDKGKASAMSPAGSPTWGTAILYWAEP